VDELALEALLLEVRTRLSRIEERMRPTALAFKFPEAAEKIGIGVTKLKEMVRSHEIRVSLVGKTPMISLSEIERVTAPREEQPRIEREQRRATWVPIEKKKPKKP